MKKVWLFLAVFCLSLTGCSRLDPAWQEIPDTYTGDRESEVSLSGETGNAALEIPGKEETSGFKPEEPWAETEKGTADAEGSWMENGAEAAGEEGAGTDQGDAYAYTSEEIENRIAIATDLHYLAKELAGEGTSFQNMLQNGDGMLTQYCQEITMAFLEQMEKEKPDVLILSGDLTKNGEKKSHEALAQRLKRLESSGVPVIVIPGNHDINNPQAEGFRGSETYAAEQISAEEFAEIYKQFGYREAVNRDPYSLSYVYALDEYTWIMMLDSCQYEPNHLVGGMIQEGTYQWIEENLETAWKEGIRVIPVSHHNLLEQTDTSEEFIRNCTIEHDERLIQMWEDNQITLHLSGHLHIQHFEQVEDESQLFDVVTGSLMIYPCKYGIVEVFNNGDLKYYTKKVPVAEWVKRHGKNNRELLQFDEYAKDFLYDISYERTYDYLREHGFTVPQSQMMAKLYANLNPNFYAGTIPQASEAILQDQAYVLWKESEYFSEVSTTIQMMIQEENHDFNTLYIPY